jgi:hypothetical protein
MWSRLTAWWSKLWEDDEQFHVLECRLELALANEINPLPVSGAGRRAEALLADPAKFQCIVASEGSDPRLEPVAPGLQHFFTQYEGVEDQVYGSRVGRGEVSVSQMDSHMLRIGLSTAQGELVVRPGEETIYELAYGEPGTPPVRTFTSIYHYLLYVDRMSSVLPD